MTTRKFAKVPPGIWTDSIGKEIRRYGPEAWGMACFLMTNRHANMIGLYYLPIGYIVTDLGCSPDKAQALLASLKKAGFCSYHPETEYVWVHEMASMQVGDELKPQDKQAKGVEKTYESLSENPFLGPFFEKYRHAFHMQHPRGFPNPSQAGEWPIDDDDMAFEAALDAP